MDHRYGSLATPADLASEYWRSVQAISARSARIASITEADPVAHIAIPSQDPLANTTALRQTIDNGHRMHAYNTRDRRQLCLYCGLHFQLETRRAFNAGDLRGLRLGWAQTTAGPRQAVPFPVHLTVERLAPIAQPSDRAAQRAYLRELGIPGTHHIYLMNTYGPDRPFWRMWTLCDRHWAERSTAWTTLQDAPKPFEADSGAQHTPGNATQSSAALEPRHRNPLPARSRLRGSHRRSTGRATNEAAPRTTASLPRPLDFTQTRLFLESMIAQGDPTPSIPEQWLNQVANTPTSRHPHDRIRRTDPSTTSFESIRASHARYGAFPSAARTSAEFGSAANVDWVDSLLADPISEGRIVDVPMPRWPAPTGTTWSTTNVGNDDHENEGMEDEAALPPLVTPYVYEMRLARRPSLDDAVGSVDERTLDPVFCSLEGLVGLVEEEESAARVRSLEDTLQQAQALLDGLEDRKENADDGADYGTNWRRWEAEVERKNMELMREELNLAEAAAEEVKVGAVEVLRPALEQGRKVGEGAAVIRTDGKVPEVEMKEVEVTRQLDEGWWKAQQEKNRRIVRAEYPAVAWREVVW